MNEKTDITKDQKGIAKVSAKGDTIQEKQLKERQKSIDETKVSVSVEIQKKLALMNTEAKMKQTEKKSSSIWNLDKIRNAERFKDVQHSSDSTVRNRVRKVQERTCTAILHNAKNNLNDALQTNFAELKNLNIYLQDVSNFANRKRANYSDLQLAYEIYEELFLKKDLQK